MFKRWSNFLVSQKIITPEDAEVQEYGLFCLVETISFHAAQLVLAIFLHLVPETLLFDATFLLLRSHTGGYHASTPMRCFAMSIAVWAGLMLACQYVPVGLCGILGLLAAAVIWRIAPLPHENNPFSPERLVQVTHRMRIILVLLLLLSGLLLALQLWVFTRLVLLVLVCTAFSLYMAWRKAHG
ncbi:MAG: accessory gene regulator B family protein [Butyricicoccus sp.]|nr:accessory gene regulator B family protein [Butyricicoccus sp.]